MQVKRFADAKAYDAANHRACTSLRLPAQERFGVPEEKRGGGTESAVEEDGRPLHRRLAEVDQDVPAEDRVEVSLGEGAPDVHHVQDAEADGRAEPRLDAEPPVRRRRPEVALLRVGRRRAEGEPLVLRRLGLRFAGPLGGERHAAPLLTFLQSGSRPFKFGGSGANPIFELGGILLGALVQAGVLHCQRKLAG